MGAELHIAAGHWPPIAEEIWNAKYRLLDASGGAAEATFADTVHRVSRAVAAAEPAASRDTWATTFAGLLANLEFLPGGRVFAGAGSGRDVTLFNCFVMGPIGDDVGSVFDRVKDAAVTMQAGGGIGQDFSTLRPRGARDETVGAGAAGPVAFMDVWDAMCRTIMSAGSRRGAMMATLRCDHPDIETFIDAKRDPARLRNFNISVLVTDAFIEAVDGDEDWPLTFAGRVHRVVKARALWERLMRATYDVAEPGVIFIDRVNALNTLNYCEKIVATNPCGEQPLPANGSCLLGAINLARLVRRPFQVGAYLDSARLKELAQTGVRFLDDVIDVSRYPIEAQGIEARQKRRIGLGVTGVADALAMVGVRYGSEPAAALIGDWLGCIKSAAYAASAALAAEKGVFETYDGPAVAASANVASLPDDIRRLVLENGLRNGTLTTIAPTGTISLLAGNVSSGIEPIFGLSYTRRVTGADGQVRDEAVEDYAYRAFREMYGPDRQLPDTFATAMELGPDAHLAMQAAAQPFVDSAISKTINCPVGITFEAFASIYRKAYRMGLKGCTTFRPNAVTGQVLSAGAVSWGSGGDGASASGITLRRDDPVGAARAAAGGTGSFRECATC